METEGSLPLLQQLAYFLHTEPNQSTYSHPISLGSSLILSSHLRLDLSSGLGPPDLFTETLCAFFFPLSYHVLYPSHPS